MVRDARPPAPGAAGVIPKESLSAYQRWELASLDPVASEPAAAAAPAATAAAVRAEEDAARVAEMAALREAAVIEGRATGRAEGLASATQDLARLAALLEGLGGGLRDREQKIADATIDLALVLARQIAGEGLAVHRERMLPAVEQALHQLPEATQRVRLHLAPGDADLVRTLLDTHPVLAACQLVADSGLATGGFRLETEQCAVDATLAHRWKRLAASLGRTQDWIDDA